MLEDAEEMFASAGPNNDILGVQLTEQSSYDNNDDINELLGQMLPQEDLLPQFDSAFAEKIA